jgi:hypothetical protein
MTTEPDLFDGAESLDEILFLTFDHAGAEGLQEVLARVDLDREDLTEAADRLQAAGLIDAAKIVRETSTQAHTRASVEITEILADPIKENQSANLAQAYRQNRVTIEALEAAKVDDDT